MRCDSKMERVVFYVDPMSYNNLSIYDCSLLKNIKGYDIYYYGSIHYDRDKLPGINYRLIFRYNRISHFLFKTWSYVVSILKLFLEVLRRKPSVVHIQWIRLWGIDYLFLLFLRWRGIAVVYTAHNVLPHDSGERYKSRYKKYYSRVSRIIVHSANSKSELVRELDVREDKITVIPHGVLDMNVSDMDLQKRKGQFIRDYALENKTVFTVLGIHSYYKGSDMIVRFWSENPLVRENSEVILFMWGKSTGIDLIPLEQLKNASVRNEYISSEDYLALLQLSDVVLLPYRNISQSGVLMSVINESVPFVVSAVGGLSDPLALADLGWCIGNPSYENFEKTMVYLLQNNGELRRKKNSADWSMLKEYYSWARIGEKTKSLYDSLN